MTSTIQIRVDDELKSNADSLFKELGTDTTTAIRMFLTQAVASNGFPFEIKRPVRNPYQSKSESEILEELALARRHVSEGEYLNAELIPENVRKIYGL